MVLVRADSRGAGARMQLGCWCKDATVVVGRGCNGAGAGGRSGACRGFCMEECRQMAVICEWEHRDNRIRGLLDHNSGASWWVAAGRAVMAGDRCF